MCCSHSESQPQSLLQKVRHKGLHLHGDESTRPWTRSGRKVESQQGIDQSQATFLSWSLTTPTYKAILIVQVIHPRGHIEPLLGDDHIPHDIGRNQTHIDEARRKAKPRHRHRRKRAQAMRDGTMEEYEKEKEQAKLDRAERLKKHDEKLAQIQERRIARDKRLQDMVGIQVPALLLELRYRHN